MKHLYSAGKISITVAAVTFITSMSFNALADNLMFAADEVPTSVLDHFMCYDIEQDVNSADIAVRVKDQFLSQGYRVLELTKLCAPAHKLHDNREFPVKYAYAHLACYSVEPYEVPSAEADVIIYNQFEQEKYLHVSRVREICVPTLKKHLEG